METVWFIIVAGLLAGYVVFDGFDIGAGAAHLFVARTDEERRTVLASIGPVWDGNEVWLLAAGGVLFFAFPPVYASAFSGFYLPLMILLWLLILRGIAIEFRNQIDSPVWKPLWDVVFAGSSVLLAVFFGAALGNVVRGVPLDAEGVFFLPLWTNFQPGAAPGVLDWYTVLVGLAALATLTTHGALWVTLKTEGELRRRSRLLFRRVWPATAALTAAITAATFAVQPQIPERIMGRPWGLVFAVLAVVDLVGMRAFDARGKELRAFLSSCGFILFLLACAMFGLYPYLLPSNLEAAMGLSVANSATGAYGLEVGLYWFVPGILLVGVYFTYVYSRLAGKVRLEDGGH